MGNVENDLMYAEVVSLILNKKYFYGHILQQCRRHYVKPGSLLGKVVHTAGVNIGNGLQPNLYINTGFYNSGDYDKTNPTGQTWGLTKEEKMDILEHEVLHLVNMHCIRTENRNDYVFGLACDLAINQYIPNLPKGWMCPTCDAFIRKQLVKCPSCGGDIDLSKDTFKPLYPDNFAIAPGKNINLPKERAAETYYDILMKELPKETIAMGSSQADKENQAAQQIGENGAGASDGDQEGDQNGQGNSQDGDDQDGQGSGGNQQKKDGSKPQSLDSHGMWSAGSDDKEMSVEKLKDVVRKAQHKSSQERSQGYMPAWLKQLIEALLTHKTVKWKSEFRKFTGYKEFARIRSTRKRLNRRYKDQPGTLIERKAHFVVVGDSSGSVSNEEYAKFFKEVDMMLASKLVTITYVECDAAIQHIEKYRRRINFRDGIKRHSSGGTDFRPPFEWVRGKLPYIDKNGKEYKLREKVDGIIYLTDGCGSFPDSIPCPTIWVFVNESGMNYGFDPKRHGKAIIMDED